MAEVMKFDDFKSEGSENAVKVRFGNKKKLLKLFRLKFIEPRFALQAAGKYRQQGRNYVVDDGDIIYFKFNAGAGLKEAKKK